MASDFLLNCDKYLVELNASTRKVVGEQSAIHATGGDGTEEDSDTGIAVEDVRRPDLKEPRKYAVLLHNDDYTTMEFVVEVLKKFFRKSEQEAMEITMQVHHAGSGLAGIYSYDIAETKVSQVTEYARENGHPLKSSMEPAD